jgi:hypothetical protein
MLFLLLFYHIGLLQAFQGKCEVLVFTVLYELHSPKSTHSKCPHYAKLTQIYVAVFCNESGEAYQFSENNFSKWLMVIKKHTI